MSQPINTKPKNIFIDIDQTLIPGHTGGKYDRAKHANVSTVGSTEYRKSLLAMLTHLKNNGFNLYILSRGEYQSIVQLLKDIQLYHIFGAGHILSANMPQNKYRIRKCEIQEQNWHLIKTQMLSKVCDDEHIDKNSVLFLDDTEENVNCALQHGYKSFQIDNKIQQKNILYILKSLIV